MKILPFSGIHVDQVRTMINESQGMEIIESRVASIIQEVKSSGDDAVLNFTRKFDKVDLDIDELIVTADEIKDALERVDDQVSGALHLAASNIRKYHEKQKLSGWEMETTPGIACGLLIRPLERVGIYVPGGKAFYPSTVLMCAIPAKVAGVKEVIMVTPPRADKSIHPVVLAAAKIAGVDKIYKIGGAQAIAALAHGTRSVHRVDKIVGPGNAYVSTAKKLLQGEVLIDSPAGPSEVLIVADASADPNLVAIDACAQAEHDEDAISMIITFSKKQAELINDTISDLVQGLGRREIIEESLEHNGLIIYIDDDTIKDESVVELARIINAIAPEHLELFLTESMVASIIPLIKNAGAIFMGEKTPVALGDYAAGTNHVLPTNGLAKRYSALNTMDFLKVIPYTRASSEGLSGLGPIVSRLARLEGLEAHALSVEKRVGDITSTSGKQENDI
ncbi:MAG: histidinol dehydrogenase [Promethearchaeota archaeon]